MNFFLWCTHTGSSNRDKKQGENSHRKRQSPNTLTLLKMKKQPRVVAVGDNTGGFSGKLFPKLYVFSHCDKPSTYSKYHTACPPLLLFPSSSIQDSLLLLRYHSCLTEASETLPSAEPSATSPRSQSQNKNGLPGKQHTRRLRDRWTFFALTKTRRPRLSPESVFIVLPSGH